MGSKASKIIFLMSLTALLVAAGCTQKRPQTQTAKQLVESAERQGPSLEQEEDEWDPVAAHLEARRQVDPSDLSKKHSYTMSEEEVLASARTAGREERRSVPSGFKTLKPDISPRAASVIERSDETVPDRVADTGKPDHLRQADVRPRAPAGSVGPAVTSVRIGQHPDKTRIVLDVSAPGTFSYELINGDRSLVVHLPGYSWSDKMQQALPRDPLLKGYYAQPDPAGGTVLTIDLRQPGKLVFKTAMGPNHAHGHRIVFDVAAL